MLLNKEEFMDKIAYIRACQGDKENFWKLYQKGEAYFCDQEFLQEMFDNACNKDEYADLEDFLINSFSYYDYTDNDNEREYFLIQL